MRLLSILLEVIEEGLAKEISNYFFHNINPYINRQESIDEDLKKLNQLYIDIVGDNSPEKEAEYKKLKEEVVIKAAKILVSEIFIILDIKKPSGETYNKSNTIDNLVIIKQGENKESDTNTISGYASIEVTYSAVRKHKIYVNKEESTIIYTDKNGNDLYLWTPDKNKRYKDIISPYSDSSRRATGGAEKRYAVGSNTIKNTEKAIKSGFSFYKELLSVKYLKPDSNISYNNKNYIISKIEALLKDIAEMSREKGMITADQEEDDKVVNLIGEPINDKQNIEAYIGTEANPSVEVTTKINIKNYRIDIFKTKIKINGKEMPDD